MLLKKLDLVFQSTWDVDASDSQPPNSDRHHYSDTATKDKLETKKIVSEISNIHSA